MADFSQKSTISITCPVGLTPFLKEEVIDLGFNPIEIRDTGLELTGNLNDSIHLNFKLRTAHRVHFLVDERPINNPDDLFKWLKLIEWENWIPKNGYFSVTSRIDHPTIDNDQFANLRVKDAVVDRLRFKHNTRPDSGPDLNKTVLFLYWDKEIARIFLDTSGESLSRRNYRTDSVSAPMQETLAAGLILSTEWKPGQHFINPMTGGGTLAIEAALIAANRAPASLRTNFGFMHIDGYAPDYYQNVREEARKATIKDPGGKIIATDIDQSAVRSAINNAKTAGVDQMIEFEKCEFQDTNVPDGDGIIIMNPPYGLRLDPGEDLRPLYKAMGDFMKEKGAGKTGYVFTGNNALGKKIGLRSKSKTRFFNTTVECRLLEYELYKGSK